MCSAADFPPYPEPPKDTVYVVVSGTGGWRPDVAGFACTKDEVLWHHVSSGVALLRSDLTDGFSDRKAELERRFPDGYAVVVVDITSEIPAEIAHHFKHAEPAAQ